MRRYDCLESVLVKKQKRNNITSYKLPRLVVTGIVVSIIGLGSVASIAATSESTGNAEADKRIGKMKELGGSMKAISAVAKGEADYTPALNAKAMKIKEIANEMAMLFPAGSGVAKARSKPEIWSKPAEFSAAITALKNASIGLIAAVATGDQGKIGKALGVTGKTCGGCHKPFRVPEDK